MAKYSESSSGPPSHNNINGLCVFCYKSAPTIIISSEEPAIDNTQTQNDMLIVLHLFNKLLGRFMEMEEVGVGKLLEKCTLLRCCEDCAVIVTSFCKVFHQLKCLELELEWKLRSLVNIMRFANRVPTRLFELKRCFKEEDAGNDAETEEMCDAADERRARKVKRFQKQRNAMMKKCIARLSKSKPRILLKRLIEDEKSNPKVVPVITPPTFTPPSTFAEFERFLGWVISLAAIISLATASTPSASASHDKRHTVSAVVKDMDGLIVPSELDFNLKNTEEEELTCSQEVNDDQLEEENKMKTDDAENLVILNCIKKEKIDIIDVIEDPISPDEMEPSLIESQCEDPLADEITIKVETPFIDNQKDPIFENEMEEESIQDVYYDNICDGPIIVCTSAVENEDDLRLPASVKKELLSSQTNYGGTLEVEEADDIGGTYSTPVIQRVDTVQLPVPKPIPASSQVQDNSPFQNTPKKGEESEQSQLPYSLRQNRKRSFSQITGKSGQDDDDNDDEEEDSENNNSSTDDDDSYHGSDLEKEESESDSSTDNECGSPSLEERSQQKKPVPRKLKDIREPNKYFICSMEGCTFRTKSNDQFTQHQSIHEKGSYKCKYCDKVEISLLKLIDHQESHSVKVNLKSAEIFNCPRCPFQTRNFPAYRQHFAEVHNNRKKSEEKRVIGGQGKVKCSICKLDINEEPDSDKGQEHHRIYHDLTANNAKNIRLCGINNCSAYFVNTRNCSDLMVIHKILIHGVTSGSSDSGELFLGQGLSIKKL